MKSLLIVLLGVSAFASAPTNCKIGITDLKTGSYAALPFEAELGEEELTTKTWELKELKRVVTARVYFTDEFVGVRWPDDNSVNDQSVTVRLDVERKAKTGEFPAAGPGTETRVILFNWNGLTAMEVCEEALKDKKCAEAIAPGGNLPILLDSCEAYVENKGKNTIGVSREVKGQRVTLTCSE